MTDLIMPSQKMNIAGKEFDICGDVGYLAAMGGTFEPSVVDLLTKLTAPDARCLDVGANIGLTACALSILCPDGKIAGVEPVPATFDFLRKNTNDLQNVSVFKHALGSTEGVLRMQGNPNFLAGSFVADAYDIVDNFHFVEEVPVRTLDTAFSSFGLDRLDFIKIDVEGFEIEAFEGGRQVIGDLKPITFLEMNHWCLNVFRRMSLPEFRDRLLNVFPFVFAIEGNSFLDYGDPKNVHHINHSHIIGSRYNNLVTGFDRDEIMNRLHDLKYTANFEAVANADLLQIEKIKSDLAASTIALDQEIERSRLLEQKLISQSADAEQREVALRESEAHLNRTLAATTAKMIQSEAELAAEKSYIQALKTSTSWKVTAPIRAIASRFKH